MSLNWDEEMTARYGDALICPELPIISADFRSIERDVKKGALGLKVLKTWKQRFQRAKKSKALSQARASAKTIKKAPNKPKVLTEVNSSSMSLRSKVLSRK